MTKTRHTLYQAGTAEEFMDALRQTGIKGRDIFEGIPVEGSDVGVMLTGSIPAGLATASSDVDFLLLSHEPLLPEPTAGDQIVVRGATHDSLHLKRHPGGIEVTLELLAMDRLQALGRAVDGLRTFAQEGDASGGLPMLDDADLKLLHRLRTGWVLAAPEYVEQWRNRFGTSMLPMYMAINGFVMFRKYLEDVLAHRHDHDVVGGALHIGRLAAQSAARAVLALAEETDPDPKWLLHLLHRVRITQPELAPLVEQVLPLLFPPLTANGAAIETYVSDLRSLQFELEWMLKDDPQIEKMLEPFESDIQDEDV